MANKMKPNVQTSSPPSVTAVDKVDAKSDADNATKLQCVLLLKNELFYARIIVLLVTIFLLLVSILYAIGQVTSLQISNYWCDSYTLEEVHQHSRDVGANRGWFNSCWRTKINQVDPVALWTDKVYTQKPDQSLASTIKCLGFMVLALLFLCCIVYYSWMLIKDVKRFIKNEFIKPKPVQKNTNTIDTIRLTILDSNRCLRKMKNAHVCPRDSGKWCLLKVLQEFMEIGLQSQALLLYNGSNSSVFISKHDVLLAHEAKFIKLFAACLFVN
eukprot:235247_1